MPQAASAHDTFWDFVSLMPESTHMLMWVMSDRAIPRSFRMMQGFGVHTFRFVNADGESRFVKFHWSPTAGTHSLAWDEAVKISGADPDFHRRDLWEAIEAGAYPEWELAVQVFTEREADEFSFDVLDATKIVPEELVPLTPIGRMVLNRNPDNFFAETEQVAFCAAHIVPGIDFSNDPLLAGRIHSYVDTQISRLGGPNFHEIPINAPIAQVHNNQRDGMHRQAIARGRVAYEPNSLGGGCPYQAGTMGFMSFPQHVEEHKVRGKPQKFAEHYNQATLFWNSQSDVEKAHIVNAFRFELTKVQTVAVRKRMVAGLRNVAAELAERVAAGLGFAVPEALPKVLSRTPRAEVQSSPSLSLLARPGDGSIATRRIAIIVADGVDGEPLRRLHAALTAARRRAALRRSDARSSREHERRAARGRDIDRCGPGGAVRRGRAAGRRGSRQRAGDAGARDGVRQGSVPALQADPRVRCVECVARGRRHLCDATVGRERPRRVAVRGKQRHESRRSVRRGARAASPFRARDVAAAGLTSRGNRTQTSKRLTSHRGTAKVVAVESQVNGGNDAYDATDC